MTYSFFSPIPTFYCFDSADRQACQVLDRHLTPLKRAGRLRTWDEDQILAGQERKGERDRQFSAARLLLLLLSADFLASELGHQQIQEALRRQEVGDAVVLPLLLRTCAWEQTDLRSLQMLPRDHIALNVRPDGDHAWQEMVTEISHVLDALHQLLYVVFALEDRSIAERFSQDMGSSGVATWRMEYDQRSFDLTEARVAMRQASSVVLIATPAAFSSKVVRAQMELAADYQRPLQMLWASEEEEAWFPSRQWQADLVLDACPDHYAAAQQALVATMTHLPLPVPVSSSSQPFLNEPRNPYKGLHAFTEADIHDFFGRDALIEELLTRWNEMLTQEQRGQQPERLFAVIGASGSGKSSVVRAGLLPRLKQELRGESQEWIFLDPLTPGNHPLEALAASLAQHPSLGNAVALHNDLTSDSLRTLHVLLRQLVGSSARRVILFLDQFEEVFLLTSSEEERVHFLDLLLTAVTEPGGPLLLLLTLRSDCLPSAIQYPALYRLLDAHHLTVFPMEREHLRQVIEQPARLPDVQLAFEGDLVGDLLFETREQVGSLPLLEFALDQLFAHRNGHLLQLETYREIGGIKGALARHAEATYSALPTPEHQTLARTLFLRLIAPGQTEQDAARRRALLSELDLPDPRQTKVLHETMDAFVRARLLTTNEHARTATVEVSHEALIREWKLLQTWLKEAREDLSLQHKITEDATEWQKYLHPKDRLYRGSQLKEARTWINRNTPSQTEATFIKASAKQRRRTSAITLITVLLLLSMVGGVGWYYYRSQPPDPTLVTTLQDNAVGSLRWAVNNAPSGSTITFASNLAGKTIVFTGDLLIPTSKRVSLQYIGSKTLSISLPKNAIIVNEGASLTLSNLHLVGGPNNPESVLNNSGTMTLTNSTVSGNTASLGGGIQNAGVMTLTNSTVSDNTASDNSGYGGGGIQNDGGTVILTFCTLFGNHATDVGGGLATLSDTTLSPPVFGRTIIQNSLIAGNRAPQNPDVAGSLTSQGYNLIQDASGAHLQSTDLTGFSLVALKIDPSLQLNGNTTTKTHALLSGSAAINVIPLASCHITINRVLITTDQRGIRRPQESACDIGAFEYVP